MIVGDFMFGFAIGVFVFVAVEAIDYFLVQRLWKLVDYWRNEQVKAKREAIAAKLQIIQERRREECSQDWWKHTED